MRLHCHAGGRPASCAVSATAAPAKQQAAGRQKQQLMKQQLAQRAKELAPVLDLFPRVQHAFAYGSGIFVQPGLYAAGSSTQGPMLDFMLAVDEPAEWHEQNIARNARHYSSLSWLGARGVVCNAQRLGAGVHFNARVPWGSQVIKYGVIGTEALTRDCRTWDTLYAAGRLQKPVLTLAESAAVAAANRQNRAAALAAALLLLPRHFNAQDLGKAVIGLSYLGDIRMGIAEDGRKIERIAAGSAEGLQQIYVPLLQEGPLAKGAGIWQTGEQRWQQDLGEGARAQLLASLPQTVRERLAASVGLAPEAGAAEPQAVAAAVVASGRHQALLQAAVASIVRRSSRGQAAAGLLMAGPARSAWYVLEKLKKKWGS